MKNCDFDLFTMPNGIFYFSSSLNGFWYYEKIGNSIWKRNGTMIYAKKKSEKGQERDFFCSKLTIFCSSWELHGNQSQHRDFMIQHQTLPSKRIEWLGNDRCFHIDYYKKKLEKKTIENLLKLSGWLRKFPQSLSTIS